MIKVFVFLALIVESTLALATEVYFSPNGGCENQAKQIVDSAKSELLIAVYSLNSPAVVDAIVAAIQRGVAVEVLTDRTQAFGRGNLEATKKLAASTPNFRVHTKNRIMHNKYAVADNKRVMLGSFNWTRSAENSNDENCLITDDVSVVAKYKQRFDTHLWAVNTEQKSNHILQSKNIKIYAKKERMSHVSE
jgi:cardiolipin hydrolase